MKVTAELRDAGYVVLRGDGPLTPEGSWPALERLLGELYLVTRMSVRCMPGATSYTSTSIDAELHTDYTGFWIPPDVQVLDCIRAAPSGGLQLLADAFAIATALVADGVDASALCTEPMAGAFNYPTNWPLLSNVFGRPMALVAPDTDVGSETLTAYARRQGLVREIDLRQGDVLVFDNHRMLHGRTAFDGTTRLLDKYHAWSRHAVTGTAGLGPALAQLSSPTRDLGAGTHGFGHVPSSYDATDLSLLRELFANLGFPVVDLDQPTGLRPTLAKLIGTFAECAKETAAR